MATPYRRNPDSPIPSIESDDAVDTTNPPLTSNSTSIPKPSKIFGRFSGIINLGEMGVIPLLDEIIALDIDEAEIERLKAGAGTNHKRFTLSLVHSKQTSSPPQTPSPTNVAEEERFVGKYRKRRAPEDFGESPRAKRPCTRSSSAQSTPDYEAREMPSRSPGTRRKHLHNTGAKFARPSHGDDGIIDLTQSSVSVSGSAPVDRSEVPDAEDPQGNEEAYTARRVKPNPATPLQRSNSETRLSEIPQIKYESPEDQPYAIAPPEIEDEDTEVVVEIVSVKRIKPENISKEHSSERRTPGPSCSIALEEGGSAVKEDRKVEIVEDSSESNAHEKERSIEVKGAPKKDWPFRHLLEDATQFFDYGNVEIDAKVENEKIQASMKPKVLGGVQPVNKLAAKPNTATLHFNLHDQDHPRHSGTYSEVVQERPPKRQRTADSGTGSLRHSSPQDAIHLDPEPTHTRVHASIATSRSHYSYAQDERRSSNDSFGVAEYQNTESIVRPGKAGKHINHGRSKGNIAKKHTVVRLDSLSPNEDRNDPISDHDDEVQEVKKTIEVQVPAYKGNAFHAPPRQKTNGSRTSKSISRASSQAPSGNGRTKARSESLASSSDELAVVNGDAGKIQRLKDNNTTSKKRTAREPSSVPRSGGAESPDQLASSNYFEHDTQAKQTARDLMNKRNAKASSSAPSRAQNRTGDVSNHIHLSSDDDGDIPAKAADMIKTDFTSKTKVEPVVPPYGATQSRKEASKRPKKGSGSAKGDVYQLLEALGDKRNWLLQFASQPWTLYHEFGSRDLIVYNEEKSELFRFPSQSITRIEHTRDDGRIVLHKPRGYNGKMDIGEQAKVYLELGNVDESDQLREKLKTSDPTIAVNCKETEHIRKIFENQRNRPPTKTKSPPEMADDIKYLKQKSESKIDKELAARQEQKASQKSRASDSSPYFDHSSRPQKAQGLAKSMRSDSYAVEDSDHHKATRSHNEEISAGKFYSARQTRSTAVPGDYVTRSLLHHIDSEIAPRRARKPRSPTPPPLPRWTLENPDWEGDWHGPVSFPPIGAKRSLVEKQDIDRLDEGEFLNDSIVNFYLRWLEHNLEQTNPDVAKRIYFHNSFFYEALTKIPRGKRGINYESVKRWTSKVDLFEKDYIIVPVCENLHWYLAIICNAPRLLAPEADIEKAADVDEDTQAPPKVENNPTPTATSPSSGTPVESPGVDTKMQGMSLDDNQYTDGPSELCPDGEVKLEEGMRPSAHRTTGTEHEDNAASEKQCADDANPIAEIKSDLLPSSSPCSTKKPAAIRKGKRASMGRKYDLNGPRILTLDSFGHTHSPTCINLKDYLLAELKTKHQKEIPPPGSLGLTVKHIPTQPNFYDCGVFLLMYVEKFLQKPDEFVRDILQSTQNLDEDWKSTSDLRREVRDLLFDLSRKQAGDKKPQKTKAKTKATSASDKGIHKAKAKEMSLPETVSSREASHSSINTKSMPRSDNSSDHGREQNSAPKTDLTFGIKARPGDNLSSKSNEERGVQHEPHATGTLLARLGSFGRSVSKGLGFIGKDGRSSETVEAGKTKSQPLEIEDSPIKNSHHQSAVDDHVTGETVVEKAEDTETHLTPPRPRRDMFNAERHQHTSDQEILRTPTPGSHMDEYSVNGVQDDLKSPSLLPSSRESNQSQVSVHPTDVASSPTKRKADDEEMVLSPAKPKRRRSSSLTSSSARVHPNKRLVASQSPSQKRLKHAMNGEQPPRYDGLQRTILGLDRHTTFPQ